MRTSRNLNSDIRECLTRNGRKIVAQLQRATPRETGRTAEAWRFEVNMRRKTENALHIINDIPLAVFLMFGTEEHTIEPSGKALKLPAKKGKPKYQYGVEHPGQKANGRMLRIIHNGLKNCMQEIQIITSRHISLSFDSAIRLSGYS